MEDQRLPQPEQYEHSEVVHQQLGAGEKTVFEGRPFIDTEVPVKDLDGLSIVGILDAGRDRFYLIATKFDDKGTSTAVDAVHARPSHGPKGEVFYMPTGSVGQIDYLNRHLILGRAMAEEKGIAGVDSQMSRAHASVLFKNDGSIEVKDLASKNGTVVSYKKP